MDLPDDIFTEPEDVDAETLTNLGPLRRLAGIWEGQRGVDVNPKADGPEQREYFERIELQADRPAGQRAAALLWPALPHPHQYARRRHRLP